MCNHRFIFSEDKPENCNLAGETLIGRCHCGAIQEAYGMSWLLRREENFFQQVPFAETQTEFVDKMIEVW